MGFLLKININGLALWDLLLPLTFAVRCVLYCSQEIKFLKACNNKFYVEFKAQFDGIVRVAYPTPRVDWSSG